MKRLFLFTTLVSFFLFSCKKEHGAQVKPAQKMYKVTFDMASAFAQTIQSVKTSKQQTNSLRADAATANISSVASELWLVIYDTKGVEVRQYHQTAGQVSNYGVIVDSLAAGTYNVLVAAGQTGFELKLGSAGSDPAWAMDYNYVHLYSEVGWDDTFFNKYVITISGPVNQQVTLSRLVCKIEVDFSDVIPQNAARLDMMLNKEDFYYIVGQHQPSQADTITYHYTIPDSVKGTNHYSISHIVLNTITPMIVTLTAFDTSNHIIATHLVTNITCQVNKRTVLTGNFSDPQSGGTNPGFGIQLDPSWGTPIISHY